MRLGWPMVLVTVACAELVPGEVPNPAATVGTLVVLEVPSRERADDVRGVIVRGSQLIERLDAAPPALVLTYAETPDALGWLEGPLTHDARASGRLRTPLGLWREDDEGWVSAEDQRGDRALRDLRFVVRPEAPCARGEGCVVADPRAPEARWCAPCVGTPPAAPVPPSPPRPGSCSPGWSLTSPTPAERGSDELRAVALCQASSTPCTQVDQRHDALRGCIAVGPACPSAPQPWASPPTGRVRWVSPSGSAAGAGERDSPWSLAHALVAADADDTILLARGRYTVPPDARLARAYRWVGACAAETEVSSTTALRVAGRLELSGLSLISSSVVIEPGGALVARGAVIRAHDITVGVAARLELDDARVRDDGVTTLDLRGTLVATHSDLRPVSVSAVGGHGTFGDVVLDDGGGLRVTEGSTVTARRLRVGSSVGVAVVDVESSTVTLADSSVSADRDQHALRATEGSSVTVARTWFDHGGAQGGLQIEGSTAMLHDVISECLLRAAGGASVQLERFVVYGSPGLGLRVVGSEVRATDLVVEASDNGIQLEAGSVVEIERARLRGLLRRGIAAPGQVPSTLTLTDALLQDLGGFGLSLDLVGAVVLRRVTVRSVVGAALVGNERVVKHLRAEDLDIQGIAPVKADEDCASVSCLGIGMRLGGSQDTLTLERFRITDYGDRALSAPSPFISARDGYIGPGLIGLEAPLLEPDELLNVENRATTAVTP